MDYLHAALDALRAQDLPLEQWELLLIDNASAPELGGQTDLTWHPHSKILREPRVGKTLALLRAIEAMRGELLVIVDDDNVLAPDYLQACVHIAKEWQQLGVWSGEVLGRFEAPPPAYLQPHLYHLAIRPLARDLWSNVPFSAHHPWGAGMCVRKEVAQRYRQLIAGDPVREAMGPAGDRTLGCDDIDIALTAIDLGYGNGIFKKLRVEHWIKPERLREEYLLRIAREHAASWVLLRAARGATLPTLPSRSEQLRLWLARRRMSAFDRLMAQAEADGVRDALTQLKQGTAS